MPSSGGMAHGNVGCIMSLADEIILHILSQLSSDFEVANIDRRDWISVSSFKPPHPTPPPSDDPGAIGRFRVTCRRFAELGAQHLFQRLVVRLSVSGIRRLQSIAERPNLSRMVQNFTYIIPRFFEQDRAKVEEYLAVTDSLNLHPELRQMVWKAREQAQIEQSGVDLTALNTAMSSFSNLKHVRLLRVQNALDAAFLSHVSHHPGASAQLVSYGWTSSCVHSSKLLSQAMLLSQLTELRLSCQLDVQGLISLMRTEEQTMRLLVAKLVALSIKFEQNASAEAISQLSGIFRKVLTAGTSLISLHLGFPQDPVSLSLESVFGEIELKKLRVFSIEGWRVDGQEIVQIVRQYRSTLRGIRLRGVCLVEGGLWWKDVLTAIRQECPDLKWISLRRVNYAKYHDERSNAIDMSDDDGEQSDSELDDQWEGNADSDDQERDPSDDDDEGNNSYSDAEDDDDGDESDGGSSIAQSDPDSDHEALAISPSTQPNPWAHQSETPATELFCTCQIEDFDDLESLRDNGLSVTRVQWKMWERWTLGALGRQTCPSHRTPQSRRTSIAR